jgi:hypothetical protein
MQLLWGAVVAEVSVAVVLLVCCFVLFFFQRQVVSFDGKIILLLFMFIYFCDPGILCDLKLDLSPVPAGLIGVQDLPVFFLLRYPGIQGGAWAWGVEDSVYLLVPRALLTAEGEASPFCRLLGTLLTIP